MLNDSRSRGYNSVDNRLQAQRDSEGEGPRAAAPSLESALDAGVPCGVDEDMRSRLAEAPTLAAEDAPRRVLLVCGRSLDGRVVTATACGGEDASRL